MNNYHHISTVIRPFMLSALTLLLASTLSGCHESMEKRCAREAKEYTEKMCPAPVAKDIIVDSMSFNVDTHTLNYYYSLQNKLDNADAIDRSKSSLRKQILEGVKNATNLKSYKDAGYSFSYTYYSSSRPGFILYQQTFHQIDYR